jgi:hypothetical protein
MSEANRFGMIMTNQIATQKDGFMHTYVSNGSSAKGVSFDNFMVKTIKGKTR